AIAAIANGRMPWPCQYPASGNPPALAAVAKARLPAVAAASPALPPPDAAAGALGQADRRAVVLLHHLLHQQRAELLRHFLGGRRIVAMLEQTRDALRVVHRRQNLGGAEIHLRSP